MSAASGDRLSLSLFTREYPPSIYGGAGVHVAQLVPQLRKLIDVDVQCMGEPREGATAHAETYPDGANTALRVFGADLSMAAAVPPVDLIHSHTWYAMLGGMLGAMLQDIPHVVTAHSLEPHRPWKAEQLAGGYRLSSWAERTAFEAADAVIAVSAGMRTDTLDSYRDLDPGQGARGARTASTPTSSPRTRAPTWSPGSASTWTGRPWSSSAGSPGRRA